MPQGDVKQVANKKRKRDEQDEVSVVRKRVKKRKIDFSEETKKKKFNRQQKVKESGKNKPTKMKYADNKKSKFSLKSKDDATKSAYPKTGKKENVKAEEMTFKDRKQLRKQKKNATQFELASKLKALWEELRKADIKAEKRTQCCSDLFKLVSGRSLTLIYAHDTCRVFQTLLKYGSLQQRVALFNEFKEHLIEILKSKYAKFLVRKLIKYGSKEQRDKIFHIMQNNIVVLVRHKESISVVEYAYNNFANATHRAGLAAGFYGPAFAIFKTAETKTLEKFVELYPDRRDDVIGFMKQSLSQLVDKSVLQHSFVHRLFKDFFTCASDKHRAEMIETVRDSIVHMLHTHDGAIVAMMCLWHGTAKDRKVIMKSFKSYVVKICEEEFGHMVLLALFDSVDDTKIVQKIILNEILSSLDELVADRYGRKVLLYLLQARDPLYFGPDVVAVLHRGDDNQHSKKEANIRENELTSYVSPSLVKFVSDNCSKLISDVDTQSVVASVIKHSTADPTAAMKALALVAAEPFQPQCNADEKSFHHIIDHYNGHYMLKRLITSDRERIESGHTVLFSEILINTVPADQLRCWTTCNRGCFILIGLIELNHPSVSETVRQQLAPIKSTLSQLTSNGAKVLLKKLTE